MPRIVNHNQYREKLLSQCFDLFAEKGYASITMQQIAQGVGVFTGTLYHYFLSKQVLFEQFVEKVCQQDLMIAVMEMEEAQTLTERIEALDFFS